MKPKDLQRAISLHRSGQLDEARQVYQAMVDHGEADPRIISLLGQLLMQMGDFEGGVSRLGQAADAAKTDTRINLSFVRGLATAGRLDEAAERVKEVLSRDDKNPAAWATLAAVKRHLGQHRSELDALVQASSLAPSDVPVLIALANAQAANHDDAAAVNTLQQAAVIAPENVRIYNNLGALLIRINRHAEAIEALQHALQRQPNYATATLNLAMAHHRRGQLQIARQVAERALSLAPDDPEARAELASILMALGDLPGAESAFLAAKEMHPGNQRVLAGLAELRERQGNPEAGLALLEDAVDNGTATIDTRLVAASLARRARQRDTALRYLAPLLNDEREPRSALDLTYRRRLGFLLGDIYDASADCQAALRFYDLANQCVERDFDTDRHYAYIDKIIQSYPSVEPIRSTPRTTHRLFIVGLPRSGTSLLETMLSQHPQVHACGELVVMGQLLNASGFPQMVTDDDALLRLADQYRSSVAAPPGVAWMTDKMPLNYQYLGAIGSMMPDAHIIHCRRDLRDTMLSCYFQNFLDPALAFTFDLNDLAHYARCYQRLMRHWDDVMGDRITTVQYEDLVDDPGFVMQPLLERLDIVWDDSVLQPQNSGRYVSTASHAQVREAIHKRSVGRFSRYRPFLDERAEIFDALA